LRNLKSQRRRQEKIAQVKDATQCNKINPESYGYEASDDTRTGNEVHTLNLQFPSLGRAKKIANYLY